MLRRQSAQCLQQQSLMQRSLCVCHFPGCQGQFLPIVFLTSHLQYIQATMTHQFEHSLKVLLGSSFALFITWISNISQAFPISLFAQAFYLKCQKRCQHTSSALAWSHYRGVKLVLVVRHASPRLRSLWVVLRHCSILLWFFHSFWGVLN